MNVLYNSKEEDKTFFYSNSINARKHLLWVGMAWMDIESKTIKLFSSAMFFYNILQQFAQNNEEKKIEFEFGTV